MEEKKIAEEIKVESTALNETMLQEDLPVGKIPQEQKPKKNKKIIYGIVLAIALVAICIGAYALNEQQRKQKILDSIEITFEEKMEIEYGSKDFDFNKLIKEKSDDVVLPEQIDTMTLGEKDIVFKVEKEGLEKEFPVKVNVVDTKAPEINIKEETVTLEYGSEYDIKENIESVKDPIDGDIPYAETAEENNYYIVEGTVDTATSADYTITIKAVDKNKTESEKTYTVHVNEEQVETPTPQQSSNGGNSYTPPVSNGGESYTPPSNNGVDNTPPPTTCSANGQWKMVSNSGYAGYDYQQAWDYGEQQQFDVSSAWYMHSFSVVTTMDVCGITGYTVKFR